MGSGGTTSTGMPTGDFLSYEMTLPGGEKQSRTCVPKQDYAAIDALAAGPVGAQLNVYCPGYPASLAAAGGMYVVLKDYATVTSFDYDNKLPGYTLWQLSWQTPAGANDPGQIYTHLSNPADATDTDALCSFKGSNDSVVGRIAGTVNCTWTNGAVLTAEFDTAYALP
jgi:hypothetical protein